MNTDEIARLAEIMEDRELTEILVETEELKLKLTRSCPPAPAAAPAAASAQAQVGDEEPEGPCICSPIVGTFYAAPAPDAAPFVTPGDQVEVDTVVCIVEAMKVMNEICAEKPGVIRRMLVENATPVEYGQPLFEIEPA
jgi:acetyl-CoA carboxylase biotin carboxyl carrier protein